MLSFDIVRHLVFEVDLFVFVVDGVPVGEPAVLSVVNVQQIFAQVVADFVDVDFVVFVLVVLAVEHVGIAGAGFVAEFVEQVAEQFVAAGVDFVATDIGFVAEIVAAAEITDTNQYIEAIY